MNYFILEACYFFPCSKVLVLFTGKVHDAGKDLRQKKKRAAEDELVG